MLLFAPPALTVSAHPAAPWRGSVSATCRRPARPATSAPPARHRASARCSADQPADSAADARRPRVSIEYCTGCRWGLRAGWMAQELLVTFESALGEVALCPSTTAGTFDVRVDGQCVWSRKRDGGFPELKVVKQLVRDVVQPDRGLGHSDAPGKA